MASADDHTGAGNPHLATREKGEKAIELLVARVSPFLVELSKADVSEPFPFEDAES